MGSCLDIDIDPKSLHLVRISAATFFGIHDMF